MKKLLLLTALLLFIFHDGNAQVSFGAKAGVNFTQFSGDNEHSKMATAFHVGVIAEIGISDKFSVQPELLYSAQGSDYEDAEEFGVTYDGTFKLNYIIVPIMAKYYVSEGLSLEVGPQIGILMTAIEEYEGDDGDSGEIDFLDDEGFDETLKKTDVGVNIGLGYKLENGINFAARYNLGLTDLNDDQGYLESDTYKNSVIQVSVGYFF